ncbi:site-specific integrase [Rubrolithibacter danxiaensis]|uniref:site-specific integrase n=1 Tax=Rubrolithibacter danxiaensis TaxID=3390805 RepID=UPI003BF90176
MASVSFVLKEPTSTKETLVYLLFRFNNQRLKLSTSEKILPKLWNAEKQRAKITKQNEEYFEFNSSLDKWETTIKNIFRKLLNDDKVPTPALLKDEIEKAFNKKPAEKKLEFMDFVAEYINNSPKSPNTLRNYKQAQRQLKEFCKQNNGELKFENITLDFYNEFIKFLTLRNYSQNTIGSFVKDIKIFMNEATDRGINMNLEYLNKRFKVLNDTVDTVYLTKDELSLLRALDLSENKRLESVRDLFIVGCYTGLRFSDLAKLDKSNFIKDNTQIKIKTQKTGETVVIPVHPFVKEVFIKYGNSLPKVISNQKMNDYLKEIGKLAELKENVIIGSIQGGRKTNESFLKYQLLTTHTARRSFATNAYLADIPSMDIMKITGHRSERSFIKYIRVTQEQNANRLINHPFFK